MGAIRNPVQVNLFFAILPPPRLHPAIENLGTTLRRAHRLHGRPITGDRIHNTMAPVHDRRCALEKNVTRARAVGAGIRFPAFPVRFEWTTSFPLRRENHPLVLSGAEGLACLIAFRAEIRARMTGAGFDVAPAYTPHITLLWADQCVGEYPVAPIRWLVEDFVLILSLVGRSRHVEMGRWPLIGA